MMYDFFTKKSAVIVLALIAGVFTLAPQIIPNRSLGENYTGVRQSMNPDEEYYMARQQEVLDGHPTLGNPYLYEHKDEPGLQVWVPDALLAWGSDILFSDVHDGALFWDLVLPGVIVLFTYAIVMLYTRDPLLSFAVTMFLSIGLYLEVFNRPVSPQFNFVFYLMFLMFFLQAILTLRRVYAIAAALSLGALFYVYTYYWTYVVVLLGLAVVGTFVFFRKERLHGMIAAILGGGLVLGIPYFLAQKSAASLPYYKESLARVGMITTHSPSGIFIVFSGAAVFGMMLALWRLRVLAFSPLTVVAASGVFAGIIATNHHIITGLNLEFSTHYHWVSMYADIFAVALCAQAVLSRIGEWEDYARRAALAFTIAFSLASAWGIMQRQIVPTAGFIASQRYAPVLAWLNAHTKIDDVVYADQTLSSLIPAYTHDDVFFSSAAGLYIMPQGEMRARFLAAHYFDATLTRDTMTTGLAYERQMYGNYYIEVSAHTRSLNQLRRMIGMSQLPIERYPEADIRALIQEWQDQKSKSFMQVLSRYRVDYVLWDRAAHPEWDIDIVKNLHEVYKSGDIVVYTP